MSVTAKVSVVALTLNTGWATVQMTADYADGRNKEWAAATPTLNLNMTVKKDFAEFFEPGATFTLTFEKDVPANA